MLGDSSTGGKRGGRVSEIDVRTAAGRQNELVG
jgi:hypothetical protein